MIFTFPVASACVHLSVGAVFPGMENSYYTPMYGGLMLPIMKRQGSDVFQIGSSMYGANRDMQLSETNTPLNANGVMSALPGLSPYDSTVSLGFHLGRDERKHGGKAHRFLAGDVHMKESAAESLLKMDDDSLSGTPAEMQLDEVVLEPVREMRRLPEKKATPSTEISLNLKLGDDGRSRLKSALSEKVRQDTYIRHRVEAIGKIRLASMQQLLVMAQEAGLWEYALKLADEHDHLKKIRHSS